MKKSFMLKDEVTVSSAALKQEAHLWLSRLTAGDVTQPELQAFKRWQCKSQAHEAAFEEAKHQWHVMKPAIGNLLRTHADIAARHDRLLGKASGARRAFLGASICAAAVVGVSIVHPPLGLWPAPSAWVADYRTATGEQLSFALLDQVHIALNTQTSVRREMADKEITGMELISGELAVDLSGGRSFSIHAGAGRSSADSGKFEVRKIDDKVCVTCLNGAVRVQHSAGEKILMPRQQVVYDEKTFGMISGIDLADASAWRKGELVFKQTPLADALEEINRYRTGRVVLMRSSMRDSPVSGRFSIAILDEALLQIQHSFDLNARSLPGGVLLLS